MAIVWRDKLLAFGIHFIVTAILAACAAAVIFLVWYPDPFQSMVRGKELFVLVVGCDLALGPLMSFVIFNRKKSRRELILDYSIVALVQIAGLVYGVYVVAESRPAYIVFAKDRLEIVAARDLSEAELAAARDPRYARIPLTGPRFVAMKIPDKEEQQAMFDSLAGLWESQRPRWYVSYESALEEIRARAQTLDLLEKHHPEALAAIADARARTRLAPDRLRWLPVSTRREFWTALIDKDNGKPVAYIELDPY
jgi:hypothetical protein